MIKAVKFGGSSLSHAQQLMRVRDIIAADPARAFVVVSALGKRDSQDNKVTDLLFLTHAHLTYGISHEEMFGLIEKRYLDIRDSLELHLPLEEDFALIRSQLNRSVSRDYLVSRGEYLAAKLMAAYLDIPFVDAADCIFFGYDGLVDTRKTYRVLAQRAAQAGRFVMPGFYGVTPEGQVRLMSRGGSDITGALVAAAVDADVYENWTDVSGVLMADPKVVRDPRPIRHLTYSEMRELSCMGGSVIHDEAIQPVNEKNIPLNIRNTNQPQDEGTLIMASFAQEESEKERFITGIAGRRDFSVLSVHQKRPAADSAALRRALELLERNQIDLENITLGIDVFSLVVPGAQLRERGNNLFFELRKQLKPDDIRLEERIALIAAVGRRMANRPGISGRLFHALGEHGINIRMIFQGAEEISIIVGVADEDYENAIRVMYDCFSVGTDASGDVPAASRPAS